MINTKGKLALGLETALDGGSIAVKRGDKLIASVRNRENISRSEDLLEMIESLLIQHHMDKSEIELIAVSDSPGSATGLRIGLATAFGLGNSLRAKVMKCSILEAQARISNLKGAIVSALYSEKTGIHFGHYLSEGDKYLKNSETNTEKDMSVFSERLMNSDLDIVLHRNLFQALSSRIDLKLSSTTKKIWIADGDFGAIIASAALKCASDNALKICN